MHLKSSKIRTRRQTRKTFLATKIQFLFTLNFGKAGGSPGKIHEEFFHSTTFILPTSISQPADFAEIVSPQTVTFLSINASKSITVEVK